MCVWCLQHAHTPTGSCHTGSCAFVVNSNARRLRGECCDRNYSVCFLRSGNVIWTGYSEHASDVVCCVSVIRWSKFGIARKTEVGRQKTREENVDEYECRRAGQGNEGVRSGPTHLLTWR